MSTHQRVANASPSIVRGTPLAEEPRLGALTLPGFIREVSAAYAAREALLERRPDGTMERWTYRDLWDRSVAVAKSLIACGLGKGERVGVLMTNRAEFLSSVFGVALAGGVAAPLSTFSTPDELEQLLGMSGCSILLMEQNVLKRDLGQILCDLDPKMGVAAPGLLASVKFPFLRRLAMLDSTHAKGAIETWHGFLALGAGVQDELVDARAANVAPSDAGVLFFSSGTTGKPKGILSAHRGVTIQLWRMRRQQGLADDVRYWSANGFFWSGNFAMAIGGTLAAGGSLVLQRTFNPEQALTLMQEAKVNFIFAWPHQWAQLVAAASWLQVDLSSLEYVDVDSPIARHPTVTTTWREPRFAYGNTETFTLSTGYPANTSPQSAGGSYGPPLAGNSLKIVDPVTGLVVPVGERGEIAIKGPTLMLGYLGTPLDETLDDEGYFRTGDGGYVDDSGRLFWEGRLNDIIKTGGANVSSVEVDEIIRAVPGVKLAQTVGVPHDLLGELVVTCIVPHEGARLDEELVRSFARQKLASYKVPRRVLFTSESDLVMTGTAKIKTSDLRKLVTERLRAEA